MLILFTLLPLILSTAIVEIAVTPAASSGEVLPVSGVGPVHITSTVLGAGMYGTVFLGRVSATGSHIAIKKVTDSFLDAEEGRWDQLNTEIVLHRKQRSEYIVRCFGAVRKDAGVYLLHELCREGDLEALWIKARSVGSKLNRQLVKAAILRIAHAIEHLHAQNVLHGDVKLANVVRCAGGVKLTDFGLAVQLNENEMIQGRIGTPNYSAPEIMLDRPHGLPADVWALGILSYMLLFGRHPFPNKTTAGLEGDILNKEIDFVSGDLSANGVKLLQGMLTRDPASRLDIRAVLTHPWFVE